MRKSYWMDNQDGNFSNNGDDTFNPEKDYIGIRLEQGVPLLDRDWNELEDIRRYQEMILRRWYIGDGTPDNGFNITANGADPNKIKISAGRYLVDGFEAVTKEKDGPDLGEYVSGKYDLVYLDLWISEIHGTPELKNPQDVNMETCARHKIEWAVKVIKKDDFNYFTQDLEDVLNKSGLKMGNHHYSPLALLDRSQAPQTNVIDLRGIENRSPISFSIIANRFKSNGKNIYTTDITNAKITEILNEISIEKGENATINISEDMVPYCLYRYILFAEVMQDNPVYPVYPLTGIIRFKRKFYYKLGVKEEKDSKKIEIKTEYSYFKCNQYISDLRPFKRGSMEVIIENLGDKKINIHGVGFIYSHLG